MSHTALKAHTYPPVGRCIYCDSTDDLRKEHIIPYGLKGVEFLPAASCRKHEAITGKLEQICLRHMFGVFRRSIGMKSRKPKTMPKTLPLELVTDNGIVETRQVPIAELPTVLTLPVFGPPGILEGRPPSQSTAPLKWYWAKPDVPAIIKNLGAQTYNLPVIHLETFMRMIAKIAHAQIVARFGLDAFKPLLLELILEGSDTPNHWVGSPQTQPPAERHLHRITWNAVNAQGTKYIVANVRLFAQLGAPVYHVVVGERPNA